MTDEIPLPDELADDDDLPLDDKLDLIAAYAATALDALDRGEIGVGKAAVRRVAQWAMAARGGGKIHP